MAFDYNEVVAKVADTLVRAGSTFREDKKEAYRVLPHIAGIDTLQMILP